MPTRLISILTCVSQIDNVSNTFWKICKAKFDAPPDRTITQFQGREIFLHQADHFLFTESTFFIKLKTFEGIEYLKDMKLQKMQSILLLENHFIILK